MTSGKLMFSYSTFFGASLLLASVAGLPGARAQAPAGPLPQAQPQDAAPVAAAPKPKPRVDVPRTKNLTGIWKFNAEESDDSREKMSQSRGGGRGGGGGGRPSGGYGGHRRYGGRPGMSDEDREKMRELVQPARSLTIKQSGADIHVVDDREHERVLVTDGRKLEKSKDPSHQELTAKWDEYSLVAEEKGPQGNKVSRTFEVLEGNQQLRETVSFAYGPTKTSVYLRFVYDLSKKAGT